MREIKNIILTVAAAAALATSAFAVQKNKTDLARTEERLFGQVRKELVTLPFYGVFDNLAYRVEGGSVTLYGQVVRPSTRDDAGRRVARIEGVERVFNQIEVLPLSGFDDDIRVRTYRAVYGSYGLYRYGLGANPSIHIIVRNGRVTLEGVVANETDAQLAYMAVSQVPYVFSVTNNLRAERG